MATGYTRQAAATIAAGLTIASADLNAEFNQAQSAFDNTTGHDHSGSSAGTGAKILLTSSVSGTLPVLNGGTGVTTKTGTGSVVLSASPTLTGTITAAAISASGTIITTVPANIFGSNAGSTASPTADTTNVLLYKVSNTNYAGISAAVAGEMCFITGLISPQARLILGTLGQIQIPGYITTNGILSTDNSGLLQQAGAPSVAANGYTKLPGGLIIQWGTATFSASTSIAFLFPVAFPTTLFNIGGTIAGVGGNLPISIGSTSTSGATAYTDSATSVGMSWIAIGN